MCLGKKGVDIVRVVYVITYLATKRKGSGSSILARHDKKAGKDVTNQKERNNGIDSMLCLLC